MDREKRNLDIEEANREMPAAPEGDASRRRGDVHSAMSPASGAPVQHAFAGAAVSADEPSSQKGETADAIKRAVESDGRV